MGRGIWKFLWNFKKAINSLISNGYDILLDIDTQGAKNIKNCIQIVF